jgi:CspA family cold shock protein
MIDQWLISALAGMVALHHICGLRSLEAAALSKEGQRIAMRQNGTVKFFNHDKGYGFISPDAGGKDVFVHITAVQRSGIPQLAEGTKVSFDIEPDQRGRGPQAVNLQLVG